MSGAQHPSRAVARAHMTALRKVMDAMAERLAAKEPEQLGGQLAVLVDGAFVSAGVLRPEEATDELLASARALCAAAGVPKPRK